jgi:zinc protease
MKFKNIASLMLLISMVATNLTPVLAQSSDALPAGVKKITSVEGITEYRLENGLKVLLFPDATKQNITVNIVYKVGSRHEGYGETGMAHLLEHLVFKGTPKHPNIPQELTSRGASPNGTTWYDRTNYFETFAATGDNLEWALDLESDRMINSFIAQKDLDSEFSVVRNEFESGENAPVRVLLQKVMAAAYHWHNYGKSTIGARSDIENVKIENLQAFYRKYYQPDNATLVVAGKIDEAKTIRLINEKFGSIPRPDRKLYPTWTVEPIQDGERTVYVRRVGDTQYVMAGYHGPPAAHPDFAAWSIMNRILTDTPSGRLYKSLVETKKATSVLGIPFATREPSYALFGAEVAKDGNLDEATKTLIETVENFTAEAPSKEDVNRFVQNEIKNLELLFNNPNNAAIELTESIAGGDWRLIFLNRERTKKVTPEDVQRVAKKYLLSANRTVGKFIPTENPVRAEIPTISNEEIEKMMAEVKTGGAVSEGEAFEVTPSNIEARTVRGQIGSIRTALLNKRNRGETVSLRMNMRFGNAQDLMNKGTVASIVGQMLTRGTAKRTRQEIRDEFDRLKSQVGVSGGPTGANVNITSTRENLAETIKLVAEILKEASFPEAEFDQLKRERLSSLEDQRSDPQAIAVRALQQSFNRYPKGDIRYSGSLDEDIATLNAVTIADVRKFHKDFYGASNADLSIVGDFDVATISELIGSEFGSWTSPARYERVAGEFFDIAPVNLTFETPDKQNALFLARLNIAMRDDDPDFAAFTLGNFILGGGFLNSRLATRIRQNEGLSYGVGSNFSASPLDKSGTFIANAIYAPVNVDKLEAAFRDEIMKAVTTGFTAEEVEAAKAGWLLGRQRARGTDAALAGTLESYLFLGRTFAWDEAIEKKVGSLTVDQVNAAMRKHLNPEKISTFKAGDFAKHRGK